MADTEREDLARLMFETQRYPNKWNDLHDDLKEVRRIDADAILAAGYRKVPETECRCTSADCSGHADYLPCSCGCKTAADPSTEVVVKLDRETASWLLRECDETAYVDASDHAAQARVESALRAALGSGETR